MNNNLTELVYIVDMSGSMMPLCDDTIGGYNAMLEAQRQLNRENPALKANVTTVFFDERYIVIHDRADIDAVKDITKKEYQPCGCTALYDAVGKTITSIGQKLAAMPEEERPGLVSVAIITDGYENSSKEYTGKQIREMIKEQREKYSWLFTFVGANIDVEQVADEMGIDQSLAREYTFSEAGSRSVYMAHAEGSVRARNAVSASGDVTLAMAVYSTALDNVE